jgi:hypothetical protein
MLTTGIALAFILNGKVQQHRQWMTRSFAVAIVFLEVRICTGSRPERRLKSPGAPLQFVAGQRRPLAVRLPPTLSKGPINRAPRP